jgi:thioredoxin-like negative regulator of GroEL
MKDFDEALKLKPEDLEARFRLAGLYVQQKQYEKAIEEYSNTPVRQRRRWIRTAPWLCA